MSDHIESLAVSNIALFSDEVLRDPYPAYRELRGIASGVYLKQNDVWFIGRFQDVRAALNDWQTFSSEQGIGLNSILNEAWKEALICKDPPVHTERRKLFTDVLSPAALKPVAATIESRAEALADKLADMGTFDGVADFAHDLPIGVVMDLIGWPEDVRPRLLDLASGSWNAAGPENALMQSGLGQLQDMMQVVGDVYDNNRVVPGGFAETLVKAGHAGVIDRETVLGMLVGYVVAAFETTISGMAAGLHLFANNPGEWQKLRENPALAMQAANEIVRLETPLQNFTRVTTRAAELSDGTVIPAGQRVIVSYASANHDERQFADADAFIIDRKERQNLAFGHGPHGCAGQGLARMEMVAVFGALARRIDRFEPAGPPERALNNIARAFSRLPMRAICN